MDFITQNQLQKYEDIINEINKEYEKQEELKKQLEEIDNKIIAAKLAASPEELKQKVFKVNVKVFNSIFDVFDIYDDEISREVFENLSQSRHSKFYLIEIYITKVFQSRIISQGWILNISVKSSEKNVSKNVVVKRVCYPFYEIIPVDEYEKDCVVEVKLCHFSNNTLTFLTLANIEVDISYHFDVYKKQRSRVLSLNDKILSIAKSYNKDLFSEIRKPARFEYKFICKCDKKQFVQSLVKNSFHKLGMELFTSLNSLDKGDFVLNLSTGDRERTVITFNEHESSLKISSTAPELYKLKLYFLKEFGDINNDFKVEEDFLKVLNELKSKVASKQSAETQSIEELKIIYEQLRNLSQKLPI